MNILIFLFLLEGAATEFLGVVKQAKTPSFFNGRRESGFVPKPPKDVVVGDQVKTYFFSQRLDHFGQNDTKWKQRYQTNDEYFRSGGPLFVMISGEALMESRWMSWGDWVKNAKIYGAYLLQFEHRYYGESHPTSDVSTESLQYLSADQALADLANFITAMQTELKWKITKSSCSAVPMQTNVSGNLAAWFRLKYPQSFLLKIIEYLEVVGQSLNYISSGCSDQVKEAFDSLEIIFSTDPDRISKIFRLCSALNTSRPMDLETFYRSLIAIFMDAVQHNKIGPASKVTHICSEIQNGTGSLIGGLANVANEYIACVAVSYQEVVDELSETSWDDFSTSVGYRQWFYQTCTEFGYYMTTESRDQPFGTGHMSLKYNEQLCQDIFGISPKSITNAIQETNSEFGSTDLRSSNTVLPNGSIDPWHALGILKTNPQSPLDLAQFYVGGSHCYDMASSDKYDSPALIKVREQITAEIKKFID